MRATPDMDTRDCEIHNAEVAKLEKDAARYRVLRDGMQGYPSVYLHAGADDHGWLPASGKDIDDALDALIKRDEA